MNRRTFLTALAGAPALAALLAACGDDDETATPLSYEPSPDEVVLRIGYEGGFVPQGTAFVNLPSLLISGDGRAFTPGAVPAIFPGPLLTPMYVRSITPAGLEKVLQLADEAGLLGAAPDYAFPEGFDVTDASDTVVVISVNGQRYEHRANALGFESPEGGSSTPARDNLLAFVNLVSDLSVAAGADNLGADELFEAEQYRFQAMVVDPTQWTDPPPTIVEWPADLGVVLAESLQCATVGGEDAEAIFASATQLTFFEEGDVAYQLAVAAVLPGDATC